MNGGLALGDVFAVLLSIARDVLSRSRPGEVMPLARYADPAAFAQSSFASLPIMPEEWRIIARDLGEFLDTPLDVTQDGSPSSSPADVADAALKAWLRGPRNVCFKTSGSTGTPRLSRVPYALCLEEVRQVDAALPPCRSILSVAPLHHSYAFHMALLLSRRRDVPLSILPPLAARMRAELAPGTLALGFPLFWQSMVAGGQGGIPPGAACLTATAPCPPGLFAALRGAGFSSVSEIYGSSETGAVGIRHTQDDPFTLLGHWQREATADAGFQLRVSISDASAAHALPDRLEWLTERAFAVGGRYDNAVQVAGVNVYPDRIAVFLEEHPGVEACRVRLMRPEEGTRLKAFVVPRSGWDISALRQDLKSRLKTLPPPERPTSFTFGSALPNGPLGKASDWPAC